MVIPSNGNSICKGMEVRERYLGHLFGQSGRFDARAWEGIPE